MKLISIPKFTIVMMIGPSNSGKSLLAKEFLMPFLTQQEIRHKYLSSDGIRRNLIGTEMHKHDMNMYAASKAAFDLHKELDVYTQYPINTPVVIVDATNISKVSRSKIFEVAENNGYNVVGILFDYKNMDDYTMYTDTGTNKRVIMNHVRSFRKNTLKELERNRFHSIYKLENIEDINNTKFVYEELNVGEKVKHDNVCIVSDLHGCYYELLELLADGKGISVEEDGTGIPILKAIPSAVDNGKYVHHLLIGDIVDKGPEVEKLVRFLHKNRDFFTIVEGNHDRHNYAYLTGKIKKSEEENKLIDSYFDSIRLFEQNEELRDIFLKLYESMSTFAYSDRFIATHAPCENKYLGKSDKTSLKAMNTIRYPKRKDYGTDEEFFEKTEEFFKFLNEDAEQGFPTHVFGHVMLKNVFSNKSKVGIDLGCVAGGYLGSIIFMKENQKFFVKKYKSKQPETQVLYDLFRTRYNDIEFAGLEPDMQKRLRYMVKNGVNFVSGTMSPANKDTELGLLESLFKGIEYFESKGVKQYMLQPKEMGSRCNLLLHVNDVTKCKAISRNAYEITNNRLNSEKTLEEIYEELQSRYALLFDGLYAEYLLLDGELLPWNAMGKELIERDFMLAYKACNTEHEILRDTGFEDVLDELEYKTVVVPDEELKSSELSLRKAYNSFKEDILSINEIQEALDAYKHQLDIFASDGELEYKPFAILKVVKKDGTEENWVSGDRSNLLMYHGLSDNPYCFISEEEDKKKYMIFSDSMEYEFGSADAAIIAFWEYITSNKQMEGVVIKPNRAYIPGVAPYMKVRNKEYLRLTYDFDYDVLEVKSRRLIDKKSIKRKLETSVKEYELGRKLLDVKMSDISVDNKEWLGLATRLISEIEGEKDLDPRL